MNNKEKDLAESTADAIDEMLRIDGETAVVWRQVARAIRGGDISRAFELLGQLRQRAADAATYAQMAALGVVTLHCSCRIRPDRATGEDLEHLINMTTPPHAKDPDGGN